MTSVPSFSSRVGLIRRSRARHAASRGGWARASQSRLTARPPRVPSAGASRCGCSKPPRRHRPTSPRETARSRSPCGVPGCRTRAAPASGAGIPWPIPGARLAGVSQRALSRLETAKRPGDSVADSSWRSTPRSRGSCESWTLRSSAPSCGRPRVV